MKKNIIISLFIILVVSRVNAQFTKAGGGVALSSGFPFHNMSYDANKSGVIAVSFKSIYKIISPFHFSPSLTFFIPHVAQNLTTRTTLTSFTIDINCHYVFSAIEKFDFYGLAGPDMLFAIKKEVTGPIIFKESDNVIGLNIGVGTSINLTDKLDIFGEFKYVFSKYDQFMLNAGLLLKINQTMKN
jgi:hypothetical protein